MHASERLLSVRNDQHDVLTGLQLRALGWSPDRIRAQVDAHRWRRLAPTVFVLHNGPLTVEQQWWAATLAVGPLAGRTALAAWGVTGWESDSVEVLVRRGARPSLPARVRVTLHESRRLRPGDLASQVPTRTTLERSAIDAAAWTDQPRAACGLLAAVVQQRRTTAGRLAAELARAGQVRHRALLRSVLDDIGGGAQALSEVDLAALCRRAGLELVDRQVVRVVNGRRRYVDARVRSAQTGRSALVEIDGALHLLARSYWEDMRRGNELLLLGSPVLRFPTLALRLEPEVVADQLRRACGLPGRGLVRTSRGQGTASF